MTHTSRELRDWAARCADMANSAESPEEHDRLRRKCEALHALADTEDWLAGRRTETPVDRNQDLYSPQQQAAE